MMHDFMITRDHAIFMDLPVVFDLDAAMRGDVPLHWDDAYGARIGIVPRFGTDADVRWFDVDPCYVFHPMNAYVDGSTASCATSVATTSMWRNSMDDFPPSLPAPLDVRPGDGRGRRAAARRRVRTPSRASTTASSGCAHRYGWAAAPRGGWRRQ